MIRYLKLYMHFLRFSFSKAMEFRLDFFFRIIMDCVIYLVQFSFFHIIYLHTDFLAGWSIEQMRVFIAGFIFIDALKMTVFSNNCWWFPIYINRGDLDYYLTKPVSTLFFLSLREFAANSFLNLIIASTILYWALDIYPGDLSGYKITLYVLLLINGTLLFFMLNMIFLLSVFWTQSPRGFGDLFISISDAIERPDRIFKGIIRKLFLYILPFSLMASFPARILFEENISEMVISIFIITIMTFFVFIGLWKLGLRGYSSASS